MGQAGALALCFTPQGKKGHWSLPGIHRANVEHFLEGLLEGLQPPSILSPAGEPFLGLRTDRSQFGCGLSAFCQRLQQTQTGVWLWCCCL